MGSIFGPMPGWEFLTMSLEPSVENKFEKIANLLLLDVPETQIAAAVGLSPGRISQIKEDENFKQIYALKASEKLEEQQLMNEGWDAVESFALKTVINTLQLGTDPDYALKAAMIANKANRRGAAANKPIPAELGTRVVLNLTQNFVNKIQHGSDETKRVVEGYSIPLNEKGKHAEILSPVRVESLLNQKVTKVRDSVRGQVERLIDEYVNPLASNVPEAG